MTIERSDVELCVAAGRVVALVLGGGRGTRLNPLTAERAKPAVPLGGRYRLVDIPLSNCVHSGINRVFVLTQFNSTSLNRHVNKSYVFDTFSKGFVEILAAEQTAESRDWFQGTADAIRKHSRTIRAHDAEQYLILSGDQLYRMDYRSLMATHAATDADITIAVLPVTRADARGFGILKVQQDGCITEFVEKPSTDEALSELVTPSKVFEDFGVDAGNREYLASMGVYLFKPEVLDRLLTDHMHWTDFGKDVIPNSLESEKVYAHVFTGFWEDIGTVRSYYEVSMRLVGADPPFRFHDPDYVIYTRPRYLPGSRIRDAKIVDSIICEGSRISQADISNSIVGIRTVVRPGVTIERSVLMGADYYENAPSPGEVPLGIGEGTRISGAIVDKNARIGRNVVIQGGEGLQDTVTDDYAIVDGIVCVTRHATIPDDTHIG